MTRQSTTSRLIAFALAFVIVEAGHAVQLTLLGVTKRTSAQGPALFSGATVLIDSGSCPAGWTELAAADGKAILGTLVGNANVGTTLGADTITPAGSVTQPTLTMTSYTPAGAVSTPTVSWPAGVPTHTGTAATFTGSALGTHAHELPFQKVAGGTGVLRMLAPATFGTGTSRAPESQSAAPTANTTSAAVLLSQAISAGTPAGSVTITSQGAVAWPAGVPTASSPSFTGNAATLTGTVSQPTFSGTQFDNRQASRRFILCKAT